LRLCSGIGGDEEMTFGTSSHIDWLKSSASRDAVRQELGGLLDSIGEGMPDTIEELSRLQINNQTLSQLKMWKSRLEPHPQRDRLGHAASKFWAVQALVTTVMRASNRDLMAPYSENVARLMELGADGVYEVGQSQFEELRKLADYALSWLKDRNATSLAIIESPLGNSLPVQVISDLASRRGLRFSTVTWNAPRNDRPSHGRTVDDSSEECATETKGFDYVIFPDDVTTGTRFLKLYDALVDRIGDVRFIPIAMIFTDTTRPDTQTHNNKARLKRRLKEHARKVGFDRTVVQFPVLPVFRIDGGNSVLIAGKRKVNFLFTLLDHAFSILDDLGQNRSDFRQYLERAWQADTSRHVYLFAPGLLQDTFKGIANELSLKKCKKQLVALARTRFPDDYKGVFLDREDYVEERMVWMRSAFVEHAAPVLGESRAWMAWNAIQAASTAAFVVKIPRAGRDQDATPYTFPFNPTLQRLNKRLRERILQNLT
jgi:hypothetical protein